MTQTTILITGAASGIGRAVTMLAIDQGWTVIAVDVSLAALDRLQAELSYANNQIVFEHLDITDEAAVIESMERLSTQFDISGVVNSAGIAADTPALDITVTDFKQILDTNVVGSFIVARTVAKYMLARKKGSIVNIASISGMTGNLGRTAYGASKSAVLQMTKVLAVEWSAHGIRVNAVSPGPVNTPMVKDLVNTRTRSVWERHVPLQRFSEPEEIASGVVFLLDEDKSSYITGQNLAVDGGFSAAGMMTPT